MSGKRNMVRVQGSLQKIACKCHGTRMAKRDYHAGLQGGHVASSTDYGMMGCCAGTLFSGPLLGDPALELTTSTRIFAGDH